MIDKISSPEPFEHGRPALRRPPSEEGQGVPPRSDVAELSGLPKSPTREDLRKASIEYYPLHAGRGGRDREPPASPAAPSPAPAPRPVPPYLTIEEGYDVGPFEKKLKEELGSFASIQNDWDIDGLKGDIPSVAQMNKVFAEVARDRSVPWEYLPDGCYARAHKACEKFLDKGYDCAKLYVIIGDPSVGDDTYPFPPWRLKAKNKFTEGVWWYHVAGLVFARDDATGKVDGYVIDPAVNKGRPLKAAEWIRSFWSGDFPVHFDTTHADVYDPPDQDYTTPVPREFSREQFDRFMPEARQTNAEYSAELKRIKDDYYAHHPGEHPENRKG